MLGEGEADGVQGGLELFLIHRIVLEGIHEDHVVAVERVGAVEESRSN